MLGPSANERTTDRPTDRGRTDTEATWQLGDTYLSGPVSRMDGPRLSNPLPLVLYRTNDELVDCHGVAPGCSLPCIARRRLSFSPSPKRDLGMVFDWGFK